MDALRKRRLVAIGSFAFLAITVLLVVALRQPFIRYKVTGFLNNESFCRGLPLSYWKAQLKDPNWRVRRDAAESLGQVRGHIDLVPELTNALYDDDSNVGQAAAWALTRLIPKHPELLTILIEGMKNRNVAFRRSCALGLGLLDGRTDEAMFVLIAALNDEDVCVRKAAVLSMYEIIPPGPKEAVPGLVSALKDKTFDSESRKLAAYAIGKVGPEARTAVPQLDEALGDKDLRYAAADALGRIGSSSKPAIPSLLKILANKMEDSFDRTVAASALGKIGLDANKAVPVLKECLEDQDFHVRVEAAYSLWEINQNPRDVMPALIEILNNDRNYNAQRRAVEVVGHIGPDAKGAVPALINNLRLETGYARQRVIAALQKIDAETAARKGIPILIAQLNRKGDYSRAASARRLGTFGPVAKEAVPSLIKALRDEDKDVRKEAGIALKKIDPDAATNAGVE